MYLRHALKLSTPVPTAMWRNSRRVHHGCKVKQAVCTAQYNSGSRNGGRERQASIPKWELRRTKELFKLVLIVVDFLRCAIFSRECLLHLSYRKWTIRMAHTQYAILGLILKQAGDLNVYIWRLMRLTTARLVRFVCNVHTANFIEVLTHLGRHPNFVRKSIVLPGVILSSWTKRTHRVPQWHSTTIPTHTMPTCDSEIFFSHHLLC